MIKGIKKSTVCAAAAAVVIGSAISIAVSAQTAYAENNTAGSIELKLNEGKYYLNGNTDSLYFELSGGQMRLITDDRDKMREFYDMQAEASEAFRNIFDFDDWYIQVSEEWTDPYSYIVHTDIPLNTTHLAWNVQYDSDGNIVCYLCADYINENTVDYNGCIFRRLTES